MTPEEFKELKRLQMKILDEECFSEYNYDRGLSNEDDPEDWCPENW